MEEKIDSTKNRYINVCYNDTLKSRHEGRGRERGGLEKGEEGVVKER